MPSKTGYRRKIDGHIMIKRGERLSKSEAKSRAKSLRNYHKWVRVVPDGKSWCIYTSPD